MPNRIQSLLGVFALVFSTLTPSAVAQQGTADIPRMPDGRPDLSGDLRHRDPDAVGASGTVLQPTVPD